MADDEAPQGPVDELPEGANAVPDDVQAEYDRRERAVWEKILDRAASDQDFRARFLDDPEAAASELGLQDELNDLDPESGPISALAEVSGQSVWWSWWIKHRHWPYRRHWHHLK
jgi:hypothetical protein